jgi:hypothetical protein
MTTTLLASCRAAICLALLRSCGGSSDPPAATSSSSGSAAAKPVSLISDDAVTRCAGMTLEKAAAIVGAAPSELTDYSRTEGRLRMCLYRDPNDRRKVVSFSLSRRDSVERAAASMQSERESMGMAQGAIDSVTGSASKKPAVEDVSGIGDDSFYSPLNGAIMLRVANVIAQVTGPADMALKKRAAEEIARGLRQ